MKPKSWPTTVVGHEAPRLKWPRRLCAELPLETPSMAHIRLSWVPEPQGHCSTVSPKLSQAHFPLREHRLCPLLNGNLESKQPPSPYFWTEVLVMKDGSWCSCGYRDGGPLGLTDHPSYYTSKCQFHWEALPQKPRWRAPEEDAWHWCTHKHTK